MNYKNFIDEQKIQGLIESNLSPDQFKVKEILDKASKLKGLDTDDVAALLNIDDKDDMQMLFDTAFRIKEDIYGSRLVLFAPLYVSNFCSNNCLYCGFRIDNKDIVRRVLTIDEIKDETLQILRQGHKRVLLLMGESHKNTPLEFLLETLEAIYSVKDEKGSSIRRINVEIAPLSETEFQLMNKVSIGTYTVFQETYHKGTYDKMHPSGPKSDYEYRLFTMDRALQNGMHDVGIGTLFGLYDFKYEVIAMIEHAKHLDKEYGVGPHTISVPRIQPADNAPYSQHLTWAVSDENFKKLIAIIRCAVPYTGMILSTRESEELRSEIYNLGISQISAGSKTNIGGYKQALQAEMENPGQFELNDCRTSGEVIQDVIKKGFIPSFCTSCYRLGRVGEDFMDQAKPGLIKLFCHPNGLTTLKEFLVDYADADTVKLGNDLIKREINKIENDKIREITKKNLIDIELGKRDVYL